MTDLANPEPTNATSSASGEIEMSDAEMLAELEASYETLDSWRGRVASAYAPTQPSLLAELDVAWPYMPPSQIARAGLATAAEHLHAIRLLIEAGELFPSATATLARTALVGAAQTVWCLEAAEQSDRLQRLLSLIDEDYRRHIQVGRFVLDPANAAVPTSEASDQMERLEDRQRAIRLLLAGGGGASSLNFTDHVLPTALAATGQDDRFQADCQVLWRQQSGAAHALTWHHYGQRGTQSGGHSGEVSEITIGGNVQRVALDYFCAFHVARTAWKLYEHLAGRDAAPVDIC